MAQHLFRRKNDEKNFQKKKNDKFQKKLCVGEMDSISTGRQNSKK